MAIASYLTIAPNWDEPISVSHIWRTSIQTSITGAEKRSALFTWRRLKTAYNLDLLSAQQSNWAKRRLFRDISNLWGIPVWPDQTELTAQANNGQKILAVSDTDNRRFESGKLIILINPSDFASYEEGTIDTFTSTQITLVGNLVNTWSAYTDVLPLITARIEATQEVSNYTAQYGNIKIRAVEAYE